MKKKIYIHNSDELVNILGEYDKNIPFLEKMHGVRISYSQNDTGGFVVELTGSKENVLRAYKSILPKKGYPISKDLHTGVVYHTYNCREIKPLSQVQKDYTEAINKYDIVVGIGPAGTGKTYLAVACALAHLGSHKVSKIVLTRPVVEAGEKLGFLPGDLYEKVDPYLRPLYDAFYVMLGPDKFRRYREEEMIEIVPLAYMRGRTIENAFIILDEAQNTLPEQMKMFLTRIGIDSKVVITGDITQIDLENKHLSGLVLIREILKSIREIKFIYFSESDIVRHELVKKIVRAYERWERKNA